MLKMIFIISGLLFVISVLIHKLYISKQKDLMKASNFVAGMGIFLGLYILSGLVLTFFTPNIINKLLILLFTLSPFVIGKFATYKTEKIYSAIQVVCILISIIFVW